MSRDAAIRHIDQHGILLVFPIDNRKEPRSLWSCLHPRSPMRWEWDEDGDDRVARLWHLREELSRSGKVVYSKWYKGRATLFSRELFTAVLAASNSRQHPAAGLSPVAAQVLATLEGESPLSTKQIKKSCALAGRANEALYQKALRELWSRSLIVAYGEFDDGAFPSLAIGATRVIFEDLWAKAWTLSDEQARATIDRIVPAGSPFRKEIDRIVGQRPAVSDHERVSAKRKIPSVVTAESLAGPRGGPFRGYSPRGR